MGFKLTADKMKPAFPWTARQRRQVKNQRRLGRKQQRKLTRNL